MTTAELIAQKLAGATASTSTIRTVDSSTLLAKSKSGLGA